MKDQTTEDRLRSEMDNFEAYCSFGTDTKQDPPLAYIAVQGKANVERLREAYKYLSPWLIEPLEQVDEAEQ